MAKYKTVFQLEVENKQLKAKLKETQRGFDETGKKGESAFKLKLAAGIAAAGIALSRFIGMMGQWIGLAEDQARAEIMVAQAIKSTGNAAGISAEKLKDVATNLQSITKFGDEEILAGATTQLLTFTNIAGTNFLRTQNLVLDLATVLDTDLKASAIMLGKALNDPVANLGALGRAGIQFSKDQKAVIKDLANTNRLTEAQNILLIELEKQYGGQAKAVAKAAGMTKQFSNQIGDLKEAIGAKLMPYLRTFISGLMSIAEWMGIINKAKFAPSTEDLINDLRIAGASIATIRSAQRQLQKEIQAEIDLRTSGYSNYMNQMQSVADIQRFIKTLNTEIGIESAKELEIKKSMIPMSEDERKIAQVKLEQQQKIAGDLKQEIGKLTEIIELYNKMNDVQMEGAKGTSKKVDATKKEVEAQDELVAAYQKVQETIKGIGAVYPEVAEIAGNEFDKMNNSADSFAEKNRMLTSLIQSLSQSLVSGFASEGLKDALKSVLNVLLDFAAAQLAIGKAAAITKTIFGDFISLGEMMAAMAALAVAKVAVANFEVGTEGYKGGMAKVHKDEVTQLPSGSNVYTKMETKEMMSNSGVEHRLDRLINLFSQPQLHQFKIKGYDLVTTISKDKKNRMGNN